MKFKTSSFSLLVAAGILSFWSVPSFAATITMYFSFEDQNGNSVGTGAFSYEAPSALADGSYSLWSFSSPAFSFVFSSIPTSFTLDDLDRSAYSNYTVVDIKDGTFNFAISQRDLAHGSADFFNNEGYGLGFSPNAPGQDWSGGTGGHAIYDFFPYSYVNGSPTRSGDSIYFNSYGIGFVSTSTVPEPSTYGLIGIAALGVAFAARRRKIKSA
jgi:hypothetical protein